MTNKELFYEFSEFKKEDNNEFLGCIFTFKERNYTKVKYYKINSISNITQKTTNLRYFISNSHTDMMK